LVAVAAEGEHHEASEQMRGKTKANIEAYRIVEIVAFRIRQLRLLKGERGAMLAEVLGISQQQMTKLERGESMVSLVQLAMIARHYNVSLERFFEELEPDDTGDAVWQRERLTLDIVRAIRNAPTMVLQAILKVLSSFPGGEPLMPS
jgi:transcriptional regulator with XRE-family HTH domain